MPTTNRIDVYWETPDGWNDLVKRLLDILDMFPFDIKISQIKEKFGGLRCYVTYDWYEATDEVRNVIDAFEKISEYTCVDCGEVGKIVAVNKYHYIPLCSRHTDK